MADEGAADVALLQEAGKVPGDLIGKLEVDDKVFWDPMSFKHLPLVVRLSEHVTVEPFRQVPVLQVLPEVRHAARDASDDLLEAFILFGEIRGEREEERQRLPALRVVSACRRRP